MAEIIAPVTAPSAAASAASAPAPLVTSPTVPLTGAAGNATAAASTGGSPALLDSAADAAQQAGAAASAAAGSAGIPMDSAFSWGGYFQAIAVLLLLMGMLWGLVWAMRKYGKFNFMPRPGDFPRESLRIEAQVPLGPRKGLVVVRFLNRRLLLGVTDQQITFLTEAEQDHEKDGVDFKDLMDEARRQKPDG